MIRKGLKIAVVGFLIGAVIASACWGQTADEPWESNVETVALSATYKFGPSFDYESVDPFPRLRTNAELLQVVIDNSHGDVADCKWQTFTAQKITVWKGNSDAILENIIIELLPNASIGNIRMIQGKTFDGVVYPPMVSGPNLTIRNFIIRGGFDTNVGLGEKNEALADAQGWSANGITTITNTCGTLTLENGLIEKCGNSAVAGSWEKVIVKNVRFNLVAKHILGLRETGNSQVELSDIVAEDCGSIDFHGAGGRLPNQDTAAVDRFEMIRPTSRSKTSGNNWFIVGKDWTFRHDSPVTFNMQPGFDLARNPRHFEIDGYTTVNFPTYGFGSLTDATTGGTIIMDRASISNSLSGMKCQQAFNLVSNSVFVGTHHRWRSGAPVSQVNNSDHFPGSDASWASVYDNINRLYDSKGWARPLFWLPPSVRNLMVTN